MISNLLKIGNRNYLCNFSKNTLIKSEDYIYFVCSEQIGKSSEKPIKNTNQKSKIHINKKIYYDNVEDITIYPIALKNKHFNNYGTSYIVEKTKLDNAISLIKKELQEDPSLKVVIISKGTGTEAMENMKLIYRILKRAKIKRKNIIKKALPTECADECFLKTTITFQLL